MLALIDTRAEKSTISLEIASKCGILRMIDRRKIENIIGITGPTTIYGTLYNERIIINNASICGR